MAEQNHEILRVEHLKKFFTVPNGMLHAVDDISFTIDAGKTLGVVARKSKNIFLFYYSSATPALQRHLLLDRRTSAR